MYMLMKNYTVKPSIIGDPNIYLSAYILKGDYGDISYAWGMS